MSDDDIEGLAAEYVLGSLKPAERRLVGALRRKDDLRAEAINAWERRLEPLSVVGPDIAPPSHLFDRILTRISVTPRPIGRFSWVRERLRGMPRTPFMLAASALAACIALIAMGVLKRGADVVKLQLKDARSMTQQTKMDCNTLYKGFWLKFDHQQFAAISAAQLAATSRMALRACDACAAGDEQDAKAIFDRLNVLRF
jgi:anti-sigma-K factor RskA